MITTIIFDMNGVIIDDEHLHELAFKEVLKKYKINLDHELYLKLFAGRTDLGGFNECGKHFKISLPLEQLLVEKKQRYLELFPDNKKAYPGVIELIKSLSKKYILALTSSSTRQEIELITKAFYISEYFQLTISADDITKGKPDPEPYLITARKLGVNPSDSIVIEDSASGVKSAITAGMKCIGITTTHSKDALKEATYIVNAFDQITDELINSL